MINTSCGVFRKKCETHFLHSTHHYPRFWRCQEVDGLFTIYRHNGKWVFCKHKERNTWEAPGGHREDGEDILKTAKRELYEETGAITFDITPICIYSVTVPDNFDGMETFGKLFFSDIHTFEKELHSEIEKIAIMDELPINWTYPEIQPKLLEEARKRGFCPKKDEIK